MEIMPEILNGTNARTFIPGSIGEDCLNRILEAGRIAPSAKNRQPWRFIAVTKETLKETLSEHCYGDERLINCGAAIVCCTTNIDYTMPNGQLAYPMDISFAASQMMFQARHEGLGAAVITTYQEPEIRTMFSVPYSMRVVAIVVVGRSQEKKNPYNRHDKKRVISFNHW